MRNRNQGEDDGEDDTAILDMSIVGDEEEQHRIELENNLQELSIQLSLSNQSHPSDHEYSGDGRSRQYKRSESSFELEYPRHNSRPRDVSIFHGQNSSFLENTQLEADFNPNYYSIHDVDDGADVHYIGNTMSTPAHHISAVTLSAGLGGRGDKRAHVAEASLSGAEYDPDRPLDSVLEGVANDLSMLNMDNTITRRKHRTRDVPIPETQATYVPLSANPDNSAILRTKRIASKARKPPQAHDRAISSHSDRERTPKAKSRDKRTSVNVQPPTPSIGANATAGSGTTNGSKFTRLAKTLAREIEASQRWANVPELDDDSPVRPTRKKTDVHRSPFRDIVNHSFSFDGSAFPPKTKTRTGRSGVKTASPRPKDQTRHAHSDSKQIVLPDVTGLTSIVGSPPRKLQRWRTYSGESINDGVEVALTKALTTLQTRLNQLESQNLVSRRRVRELEIELENCKLEVKRERTRVLEKEEIIVAQQKEFQRLRSMQAKQARRDPDPVSESRYNDVVEEKKALEALVSTLRSHLSRLTDELSNQRAQLDELRSLREHDIQEVREKLAEVESLNLEVERLGGEVEILRGVVEEGLNERRRAKQAMDSTVNYEESASGVAHEREATASFAGQNDVVNDSSHADFPSPPPSRPQSRQEYRAFGNRAQMSSAPTAGPVRFDAPADEVSVVEDAREEARERPGEQREKTSAMRYRQDIGTYQSQAVHENGRQDTRRTRFAGIRVTKDDDNPRVRRTTDNNPMPSERLAGTIQSEKEKAVQTGTPFPQIRGERLERLFFSAPEHNEKTCRVCHRHRRPGASDDELDFPSWLPPRKRCRTGNEDGRHHYEIDDLAGVSRHAPFSEDRLPPQTVLVRVLGELEDDFTHYKGIYIELADQYKIIDAASNVAKRNVLAEHLREVIDTLEQKGDQIASLYDLLAFKDKPVSESVVPERPRTRRSPRSPRSPRRHGARQSGGLRRYATCV